MKASDCPVVVALWSGCSQLRPRIAKTAITLRFARGKIFHHILSESKVEQPVVKATSKVALLQVLTPPVGKLRRVGAWGLDGILQR